MIPSTRDLQNIYHELACCGANCVDPFPKRQKKPQLNLEDLFCRACELSRYDPRLVQIAVQLFWDRAEDFNPLKLRFAALKLVCPQTVAVILEFIKVKSSLSWVRDVCEFVTKAMVPIEPQLYTLGIYPFPQSSSMRKASEAPLQEFLQWGFLAHEKPILQIGQERIPLGTLSLGARQNLIKTLAARQKTFSIGDYLAAIEHSVSRQQAFLDLKSCRFLKARGKGRGSCWQRAGKK